jgi:hypothetical protein
MGIKALADAVAAKVARRNAVKVVTDQMTEREAARQARIRHRDQVRHDMPAREDLVESKVRASSRTTPGPGGTRTARPLSGRWVATSSRLRPATWRTSAQFADAVKYFPLGLSGLCAVAGDAIVATLTRRIAETAFKPGMPMPLRPAAIADSPRGFRCGRPGATCSA